jgi:hypothetical protein
MSVMLQREASKVDYLPQSILIVFAYLTQVDCFRLLNTGLVAQKLRLLIENRQKSTTTRQAFGSRMSKMACGSILLQFTWGCHSPESHFNMLHVLHLIPSTKTWHSSVQREVWDVSKNQGFSQVSHS